jgi:hypothetical protein
LPWRSSLCISWRIPSSLCARWRESSVLAGSSPLASGTTLVGGDRSACSGLRQLDPAAQDESELAGARAGHLAELFEAASLHDVDDTDLAVRVEYASFDDWWEPFTLGVGPAGAYVAGLDAVRREELKERCWHLVPDAPFTLEAIAWAARGRA